MTVFHIALDSTYHRVYVRGVPEQLARHESGNMPNARESFARDSWVTRKPHGARSAVRDCTAMEKDYEKTQYRTANRCL
jgi:hypothetical protein